MTYLANLLLIVTVMSAPYLVAAGLTAAFPNLRRGAGHLPRTGEVGARFFDGRADENAGRDPRRVDAAGAR
ncbi:hypothetical protein MMAD_19130 [Mycolicibacterium madagascariense]|uniref:Uncharacterized protein n=1 Tax=Mycolicibacterium madagascariense TaxID=212765 RepID=A0A7I7XEM0_9MYCO|nr:hypothetical protein [Mycolicibacterium madagascariense]MCV7015323.1 hypothetical protein [Mycolicibacterium madagascariense]BBZ27618.1 hypothetical protein MMAD_19130 [Mycolicibacterium madagascariense]